MFPTAQSTPLFAGRSRARALKTWREAARLVAIRWRVFLEAEPESRAWAFASYVAALDAEDAAAAEHGRRVVEHRRLSEAAMELRHLRYFVAIAEERSFTGAAERLWVAQPGLSTQMRRLEAELGVKLFVRHTRGVDLTQAGELFLERARIALAAAETAGATGRDLEAGVIGSVRLGVAAWGRLARRPPTCSSDSVASAPGSS